MKDERAKKWVIGDEFLLDSAEKRLQNGDYLGALTMLNRRDSMYGPSADAQALYADVYEGLELWSLAADAWFRFLDTCNEADFPEGYEGLGVCFMNLGNEMQSAFYYHRALTEGDATPEELGLFAETFADEEPRLRIVHAAGEPDPETLRGGLALLKAGDLVAARLKFGEVDPSSPDFPSAAGLAAMCTLMLGDEAGAERECEALLEEHPDNVQALTTYCAVLGARGNKDAARAVAGKLATLEATATDDLYRIATALCETGLHREALEKLTILKDREPYDENVLYFHAVAAKNTGDLPAAIDSLERLVTVYPRKAVAQYYLERMRELRDGDGEDFPMTYYYRLPEDDYRTVANFLLSASTADEREAKRLSELPRLKEFLFIAFDEMEGRDEKLQMLAVKVAVRLREDGFLRDVLLNADGDEIVKLSILHELTARNEDDSFGTVFLNVYREFFVHRIDIGEKKAEKFLRAFSDVYAKYALIDEGNELKICAAAEDIYRTLEEAEAWDYMDDRPSLAAAIYRESRISGGERELSEIVKLFDANRLVTQEILNYMI